MFNTVLNQSVRFLTRNKLSVFLFHAVPPKSPSIPQDFDLPQFEAMLGVIRSHFKVIPLDDAVRAMKRGKLPPRSACLTFDDGYASWMDGVVPLLERESLHATFYITTGQFDGLPTWHERVAQAVVALPGKVFDIPGFGLPPLPIATLEERRRAFTLVEQFLKYQCLESREHLMQKIERVACVLPDSVHGMTVPQLKALAAKGFGIGAHTHSHPILSQCDATTARNEIGQARETLESMLAQKVIAFAYPNGRPSADFTSEHVAMVKAAGYQHAVTTHWGAASADTSEFEIPRFTPWGPSPERMALQLARNLLTPPKVLGQAPTKPPVVLIAENGAGFGGAVVALRTLLGAIKPEQAKIHVVANMPVANYSELPVVCSYRVIQDRFWNTKPLAEAIANLPVGLLKRPLHFALGRVDDVLNRIPYLFRFGVHACRIKPDVIHGNNEPNSNREAMLVAKVLRIPYVQHLRGELAPTKHLPWLLRSPAAFIPVSRWLAADLCMRSVPSERIRQVYDGVDWSQMSKDEPGAAPDFRDLLGLHPETILVAMIGMFVPWKGQDLFIEAVAKINDSETKTAFLIVGDAPERGDISYAQSLKIRSTELRLNDSLHFLGKLNNLGVLMSQFDVVVSASTKPEPFGLVMMEALAAKRIFVAPAFGAATEVVIDGENGYLFEPNSVNSLASKLEQAIASAVQGNQEIKQSLDIRKFTPEACAESTLLVYAALQVA